MQEELPLFAALIPRRTAEDEYWRWRQNVALGVERCAELPNALMGPLINFQLYWLRDLGQRFLSPSEFAEIDWYIQRTYPNSSYWVSAWKRLLTGQAGVPCRLRREQRSEWVNKYNTEGVHILFENLPKDGWSAPFSREQMDAMFRVPVLHDLPQPDLDGKFELLFGKEE